MTAGRIVARLLEYAALYAVVVALLREAAPTNHGLAVAHLLAGAMKVWSSSRNEPLTSCSRTWRAIMLSPIGAACERGIF